MKKQKLFAVAMAAAMTLSMAACGGETQTNNETTSTPAPTATTAPTATPVPTQAPVADPTATPVPEPQNVTIEGASVNFEDGNMGFVAAYMQHATSADVELSIVDFNGSKALQVTNLNGKVPFVAIDATSLLGANVANVAGVELVMGISHPDGSFNAVAGKIMTWDNDNKKEVEIADWSVYMAKKNPKVTKVDFTNSFSADVSNIVMFSLKEDNGAAKAGNATMYIDDIRFYDKDGNTITADTTVAFVEPEGFSGGGADYSNLYLVQNAVEFPGFATSAGAWAQAGFDMPQEIIDALVPGSVVEISYKSDDGAMWVVMPGAAVGWSRVADGGKSYTNNSKNVCQVTYEQIAAVCGEDKSTWGTTMQCEGSSNWEVYSVKVGTAVNRVDAAAAVEFDGFTASAGAWTQAGFDMPQTIIDALVPGSVIEIDYSSEDGAMWIVMPGAAVGWSRVGDGGKALCAGGKCYVTYEQIAAVCGEDKSTWGATLQCEGSSAWEVYGLRVGTKAEFPVLNSFVQFPDFAASAGAWTQAGFDMPQEIIDALVPGSVVEIAYTSEDGAMWLVMPGAAVGWSRVGDGGKALCENGICYVTYEQIAAVCGEDKSTWGATMQCEGSSAWEVYSVRVGQTPAKAE
ncbi:MAG: hypothetical protein J6J42_08845 [Lachnospiraceae bacterium]|nr:hypothetical protein [Lachnospiraceae bacterium]